MDRIAIVTDSNSGITQQEAKEMGIFVVPMPFAIDEELFYEEISITREEFYEKQEADAEIFTSQPAVADIMDLWTEILKEFDYILHIPMSSGLSSSCQTALMLAEDFDNRVRVIDNHRISVTLKQSIFDGMKMIEEGRSIDEVEKTLIKERLEASIYIMVDTLKYLKKGGRVTAAGAAIGTVLKIKPVLQIQGSKLDAFAKARGRKNGKKIMLDAIEKDLHGRFRGQEVHMALAHTCSEEVAKEWQEEVEKRFPGYPLIMDPLSLSVTSHIGQGALAIACSKVI
ncbi:DegV family protein with EDD domain [Lachnospiraceae bacterium PF1-21]|uniref:DegV family protein n=1 Tax=Ohessyouella blattaphilus TaxID=2949333 RepID=A0ABT1EEN6_9FIRM|nr:DegV family protein [Ohessyouella blattaphilus]MCP1109164.1 DegV family protein [Ohessyouella blattaphilus]MCR8562558.1 DegV family protein [Ohessyouella blattaphilus]